MNRIILGISIAAALVAGIFLFLWLSRSQPAAEPVQAGFEPPSVAGKPKNYVFSIVLHKAAEIEQLLARAEKLAQERPVPTDTGIALVLHGPEIEFFRRGNYPLYKAIVDRARRLDRAGIIEVKMCRTRMRSLGIREQEIPDFIELVPYGPAEVDRLKKLGYVSL